MLNIGDRVIYLGTPATIIRKLDEYIGGYEIDCPAYGENPFPVYESQLKPYI